MEYFKQLNINEKSSKNDIKQAYFKLILKHHPDKGGNSSTFISIQDAYNRLLILNTKSSSQTTKATSQTVNLNSNSVSNSVSNFSFNNLKNFTNLRFDKTNFIQNVDTNKYKHNLGGKTYDLRRWLFGTLLGYIGIRHLLPKKEIIIDKYNSIGDKLVGHTHINCILFHEIIKWYDDDHITYKSNSYYWRRIKILYNDTDRKLIFDTEKNIIVKSYN